MGRPLAVIVNSYNRVNLLREALSSLVESLADSPIDASITIFDAGSSDGSIEYIEQFAKRASIPVYLVQPDTNEDSSFAAGVNKAIQEAAREHPEIKWCFLYETDNCLKNPAALLEGIRLLKQHKELAAVGFTVERHDGRKASYGERFPTSLSFVLGQQVSAALDLLDPQPVWRKEGNYRFAYADVVYTSPLLISYECWIEVGGMSQEVFPFTGSDVDLCWRISKSGKRCGVLDIKGVVHDNRQIQSEWSASRVLRFHESRWKILQRHRNMNETVVKGGLLVRHISEILGLFILFLMGRRSLENIANRFKLLTRLSEGY